MRGVKGSPVHGSGSMYNSGCRCSECRGYKARLSKQRYHARRAQSKLRLDPSETREHLTRLLSQGMSKAGIARQAGISVDAVDDICRGTVSFVGVRVHEAVLGVTTDDDVLVPGWKVRLLAAHIERAGLGGDELAAILKIDPSSHAAQLLRKRHKKRTLDKYVLVLRYLASQGRVPAKVLEDIS